jgi:ribosomal-protein-alanine N-acetyltransferase
MINTEFRIETARLVMREWSLNDTDNLYELNSDPEVVKFTGNDAFKNKQEVVDLISNYDQYKKFNMGRWVVESRQTGEFFGWCGLKKIDEEIDLGYRFMKRHWRKGYATESSIASLNYGFNRLGLKRIIGRAVHENINSIRVLKKLGMEYEKDTHTFGHLHQQYFITAEMWKLSEYNND